MKIFGSYTLRPTWVEFSNLNVCLRRNIETNFWKNTDFAIVNNCKSLTFKDYCLAIDPPPPFIPMYSLSLFIYKKRQIFEVKVIDQFFIKWKKKTLSLNVYSNQYRFLFSVLDVFIFQVNIITNNASQIAKKCVYANHC